MYKFFKISFINLIILSFLVGVIEIFFGYWFDEYNFGPEMRGKRIQKVLFKDGEKDIYFYKDFYGFRTEIDNIGQVYDASKIKIIFTGGSTSEEMFLNYEDTIVGNLNKNFQKDSLNYKIYNAAVSGKSSTGHVNEFHKWFDKIPNFKPEIMIYYLGLNDREIIDKKRWHDYHEELDFLDNIIFNISQKSIFWEKSAYIKNKYFFVQKLTGEYFTKDKVILNKIAKNEFISYDNAKKIYTNLKEEEEKILSNYNENLKKIKKNLEMRQITPIFVTQITNDINGDRILFFLNEELKKFCKRNNYFIIKLDEKIDKPLKDSFVDLAHTNKTGSKQISKIIYPLIKEFLVKELN
tara:strand:+ start:2088 stop:3140 length:1053 start_codon:yes stop_codon:yes gene_type:complete